MIARIALILSIATAVEAAPRVDLDRCTGFGTSELQRAIDRELSIDVGDHPYVVIVECPDLVTAIMHVEPEPATGAIARAMDLGEVPSALRLKLLALATAEMVKVATSLPPPTTPIEHAMPVYTPKPASELAATAVPPDEPMPVSLAPRAGIRFYAQTPHPMATLGAELGWRSFRIGVEAGFSQHELENQLGRARAWLGTVTVAYEVCRRASVRICGLVRAELGEAEVTTRSSVLYLSSDDYSHAYTQVGPALEATIPFGGWSMVAELDAGYGWGLIAQSPISPEITLYALAGWVGGVELGARWQ